MSDRPCKRRPSQRRHALQQLLQTHLLPDLCVLVDDYAGQNALPARAELHQIAWQSQVRFTEDIPRYAEDIVDQFRAKLLVTIGQGGAAGEHWFSHSELVWQCTAYSRGVLTDELVRKLVEYMKLYTQEDRHVFREIMAKKKYETIDENLSIYLKWSILKNQ